jgi:acyl-CoA thioester hydrolase
VQFLTYVEEARVEMFQSVPLSGLHKAESGILVAASDIRYRRPLFHRSEPVPIDVWVTKIGAATFALGYEVYDADGTVYATAGSTMVPYDFAAARPRRLTPEERTWLKVYLEPVQPADS